MNVTQIPVKTVRHAPKAILVNIAARAKSAFKERIVKLISMNALSSLVNLKQSVRTPVWIFQYHRATLNVTAFWLSVLLVNSATNVALGQAGPRMVDVAPANSLKSITLQVIQPRALTRNVLRISVSVPTIGMSLAIIAKNALMVKNQSLVQAFVPISMNVIPIHAKMLQRALNQVQALPFHWANINVHVALVFQVTIVRSTINVYQIPVVLTV